MLLLQQILFDVVWCVRLISPLVDGVKWKRSCSGWFQAQGNSCLPYARNPFTVYGATGMSGISITQARILLDFEWESLRHYMQIVPWMLTQLLIIPFVQGSLHVILLDFLYQCLCLTFLIFISFVLVWGFFSIFMLSFKQGQWEAMKSVMVLRSVVKGILEGLGWVARF